MPNARLHVTLPDATWIGAVSRRYPDAVFSVLAAVGKSDEGAGLVEIRADSDLDEILGVVEDHEEIQELDLLEVADGQALVRFTTDNPLLVTAATGAEMPFETPFDIEDGVADWTVQGSRERMSELGDTLRALGLAFEVSFVGDNVSDPSMLTDNQYEVIASAVDHGYYETPREITLSGLADELGIAKSTCSETLSRAEAHIVKAFLEPE